MAEEPVESDVGPGKAFDGYSQMESLLDNLKMLDYDSFVKTSPSYKTLSRHYFVTSTNPGEQFYMFVSTAAFLLRKAGKTFEQPQEHDDPNAIIAGIMDEMRNAGLNADFSPASLKSGAGDNCIMVLNALADLAVNELGTANLSAPQPPQEEASPEEPEVEEAELTVEQFDEEEPEDADDDDEAGFLSLDNVRESSAQHNEPRMEILKSETDSLQWKQEVERVLPSLKVTLRQDAKDWRSHLEQLQTYRTQINTTMTDAGAQLTKLSNDIGRGLDKIGSREKYLNQQLDGMLSQFRTVQDRCAEIKEQYKEAGAGVTERSRRLAQITEDLEQVKQTMEDRGSNLTDGAPLVKIKQAITRLQQEIEGMDVQVGVIEQSLLQAQLRNRNNMQADMHAIPQLDLMY